MCRLTLYSILIVSCCSSLSAQIEFGEPKLITTIVGDILFSPAVSPDGLELYYTLEDLPGPALTEIHWATREAVTRPWISQGAIPALQFASDNDTAQPPSWLAK